MKAISKITRYDNYRNAFSYYLYRKGKFNATIATLFAATYLKKLKGEGFTSF